MSDENENAKLKDPPMRGFSAMDVAKVKEIARGGARKAAQLAARPRANAEEGEEGEEVEEAEGEPQAPAKAEEKPASRERGKK